MISKTFSAYLPANLRSLAPSSKPKKVRSTSHWHRKDNLAKFLKSGENSAQKLRTDANDNKRKNDEVKKASPSEKNRYLASQLVSLGGAVKEKIVEASLKSKAGSAVLSPSLLTDLTDGETKDLMPIEIKRNDKWVNPVTRLECKYAPVTVDANSEPTVIESMRKVESTRIKTCMDLAKMGLAKPDDFSDSAENNALPNFPPFSFIGKNGDAELGLGDENVPVIVISGGSANKIAADLQKNYSLAWHPEIQRNEPVYLLVHKLDYKSYNEILSSLLDKYKNMHLIGWDCTSLTGFGAAREAALALADTLSYRPKKILMMDQDVIQTENTRHTNPTVQRQIRSLHITTRQPIVGFGVGFPTRENVPVKIFNATNEKPSKEDLNSPVQQFVSIEAPFRDQGEGIYPMYMVAGGEDMLMGMNLGLISKDRNGNAKNTNVISDAKIIKKSLTGLPDTPNTYWNEARVKTLKALFDAEKETLVSFEGKEMSLGELMQQFVKWNWIKPESDASGDFYNTSACIIERIILRLHKNVQSPQGGVPKILERFRNLSDTSKL